MRHEHTFNDSGFGGFPHIKPREPMEAFASTSAFRSSSRYESVCEAPNFCDS